MENHPIPQDITGFQFKLIGSMTIKQFAYLVSGVILAWLIYIFPIPALIKIPLALFLIFSGASLAFIPLAGRPMDIMLINLIKALFSPTQYVYSKTGGDLSKIQVSKGKSENETSQKVQVSQSNLAQSPTKPTSEGAPFHGFGIHLHKPKSADKKPEEVKESRVDEGKIKKEYEDARQIALQKELEIAKKEEEKAKGAPSFEEAHAKVLSLSEELQQTIAENEELQRQLTLLQKKLMANAPTTGPMQQATTPPAAPATKIATPAKGAVLTPEAPNVIMGVVKDPRGNPLPNILVEVKDSEDNPVRAFKTNGLGQFASATPLSNGTYTIYLEDSKNQQKFDAVKFDAIGEIIPPIEVISVYDREELRRSLFN